MSGAGAAGTGQEPSGSQNTSTGQEPNKSSGNTGQEPNTPNTETPETLRSMLEAERKENAKNRIALQELTDLRKYKNDTEAATLSDVQKKDRDLATLQARYDATVLEMQTDRIRYAATEAAESAGMTGPKRAYQLIDYAEIEYDKDSGKPTNIAKLVGNLKAAYPELFPGNQSQQNQTRTPSTGGGATSPARGSTAPTGELTLDAISKMSREEYNSRRPEIMAFYNSMNPYGRQR